MLVREKNGFSLKLSVTSCVIAESLANICIITGSSVTPACTACQGGLTYYCERLEKFRGFEYGEVMHIVWKDCMIAGGRVKAGYGRARHRDH